MTQALKVNTSGCFRLATVMREDQLHYAQLHHDCFQLWTENITTELDFSDPSL